MVTSSGEPVDLSAKGRKLLARIRDYEEDGLTGRKMLERLRKQDGLSISDRQFWNTRRLAKAMRDSATAFNHTRLDLPRDISKIPLAPFRFTRGRIQYLVAIRGRNNEGETIAPEYVTVSAGTSMSRQQVINAAIQLIRMGGDTYGIDLDKKFTVRIEEMWRNE